MSILNIKDPEAHALASELARRTGHSLTRVVTDALRERLERVRPPVADEPRRRIARVLEIGRRAASRPVLDARTPEEILGYDADGLPRS